MSYTAKANVFPFILQHWERNVNKTKLKSFLVPDFKSKGHVRVHWSISPLVFAFESFTIDEEFAFSLDLRWV